jgi:RNA polymerase sigma-70 factor (ECF subfamily)
MLMVMIIYGKDDELYVEKLYLDLKNDMLYAAKKILHNQEDAEDAVQTAFELIIRYLQTFQNSQKVYSEKGRKKTPYCIVIVRNVAFKMYNDLKKKSADCLDEIDYKIPCAENIEDRALQSNLLASLDEVVKTMPESLSKPFVMRFYDEMKYPDIGDMLGISANAAQKRAQRAVDIVLEKLGDEVLL